MAAWIRRGIVALFCLLAVAAAAQEPVKLRVKVFPGAQNLPHYAGLANGFFAKHGIALELLFTQNSTELRDGLAAGEFDLAHSGVDNAVAMIEQAGADVVIVAGGDSSMNELIVQPDIGSVAALRGRTLVVDAPNTAYALQAKKILLNAGLGAGDYAVKPAGGGPARIQAMNASRENAATLLYPPFSIQLLKGGLRSLGRTSDLLGPYQATGAFAMRPWVRANGETLTRYLAAFIEATRWARDPANREACLRILAERFKLDADVAARTYAALMDPAFGLYPDARFNLEGFRNVLALRAEIEGQWAGRPPAPDRYLDLSWFEQALSRLGGR